MTRKFKAGDIVKLEGKLIGGDDCATAYPLRLDLGLPGEYISFTVKGEYLEGCDLKLELVKAAPVELAVGQEYTKEGITRVILDILDGIVFYRHRNPHGSGRWFAEDLLADTFKERYAND